MGDVVLVDGQVGGLVGGYSVVLGDAGGLVVVELILMLISIVPGLYTKLMKRAQVILLLIRSTLPT